MTTAADAGYRLFIDGEWVEPAAGHYAVVNPATEQVVGQAPEASVDQVRDAVASSRAAFRSWSRTKPADRAEVMTRISELLDKYNDELVPLVQAETGATQRVASTMQVPVCVERFRRYARQAVENHDIPLPPQVAQATPLAPGGLIGALAARQPVGVVACITPYNFPLVNMAGKIAPALAMGNTVVVKPAPQDPLAVFASPRSRPRPACRPACSTSSPDPARSPARRWSRPTSTWSVSPAVRRSGRRSPRPPAAA